jgi:hypothetical protein
MCDTFGLPFAIDRKASAKQIRQRGVFNRANNLPIRRGKLSHDFGELNAAEVVYMLNRIIQQDRPPLAPG